jgi:hypothetical protein
MTPFAADETISSCWTGSTYDECGVDGGERDRHRWQQPLLSRAGYMDDGDPAVSAFLVSMGFHDEDRPDAFRTIARGIGGPDERRRGRIRVATCASDDIIMGPLREYRLGYADSAVRCPAGDTSR